MAAINVAGVRGDLCGAVRWIKAIHVAGVRGDPCGAVRWIKATIYYIYSIANGLVYMAEPPVVNSITS